MVEISHDNFSAFWFNLNFEQNLISSKWTSESFNNYTCPRSDLPPTICHRPYDRTNDDHVSWRTSRIARFQWVELPLRQCDKNVIDKVCTKKDDLKTSIEWVNRRAISCQLICFWFDDNLEQICSHLKRRCEMFYHNVPDDNGIAIFLQICIFL